MSIKSSNGKFYCKLCGGSQFIYPINLAGITGAGCTRCGYFNQSGDVF